MSIQRSSNSPSRSPRTAPCTGLSERDLASAVATLDITLPGTPPGPPSFTGTKLIYDALHPYIPPGPLDIRGPCPGLNTLANHGYLPRIGIATPAQIISAVMEGFNMENGIAKFVTYAAFVVDGNPITDLLSIGRKSVLTGDLADPAIVGGLNTHGVFEGDASTTRLDAYLGNNFELNDGLWNQYLEAPQQAHPPIHRREPRIRLHLPALATLFFKDNRFPKDFWRAPKPSSANGIVQVFTAHPIAPGRNAGKVNSYTVDPNSGSFTNFCALYYNFVNQTVKTLYPNPTGILQRNLAINLGYLYESLPTLPGSTVKCDQLFPYGQV
ncbi:aromatic peroxygenase precursor [Ephemerocybe angulata]|uniref:Aromatic peroxygenase n=1 Tax=Ephemerocybe angulata TaxID=980116 RepID=A0A8H6LWV5_9AGAR|nr:aromatic peroxygenase precursor [Tulosesus angulatus]